MTLPPSACRTMHVHFLDPYRPGDSPVHRLDGRVKFLLAVAFILAISLTPPTAWPVHLLFLALLLSVEILSGLGLGYVWRRAALALPFALAALPLVFTRGEEILLALPASAPRLAVYAEGLERFVSVVIKSLLSIQVAIVLVACTPFPQLLQAMRGVGVPRLLVAMFGMMWRYLFVLVDEALRLLRARAARAGQVADRRAGGRLLWRARVTGGMAGSLFLRGFERSERIYAAMLARGYDGETRALPLPPLSASAWAALIMGFGLLSLLLTLGFLGWG